VAPSKRFTPKSTIRQIVAESGIGPDLVEAAVEAAVKEGIRKARESIQDTVDDLVHKAMYELAQDKDIAGFVRERVKKQVKANFQPLLDKAMKRLVVTFEDY
jgi:hypothetical protein